MYVHRLNKFIFMETTLFQMQMLRACSIYPKLFENKYPGV